MKRNKVVILVLLLMVLLLACSTIGLGGNENTDGQSQGNSENGSDQGTEQNGDDTNQSSEDDADPSSSSEDLGKGLGETEFGKLLASGSLSIEDIKSNADGETVGEILTVHFVNQSDDEIQVFLPCGLVFVPNDSDEQPLMMVQPLEVSLGVGEEVELEPFVVCADLGTAAPGLGSGYTIGYLEDEKLLKFAECICGEEVDTSIGSMDALGIQFATWSITIDGDVHNLIDSTEESALSEMMEGMSIDEFAEYFSGLLDMFGNEWLNRCDIVVEE